MVETKPQSPLAVLLVAGVLGYAALLFIAPLIAIGYGAFRDGLQPLIDTFTDPSVIHAFQVTFTLALLATAINALFGLITAWVLVRQRFRGRNLGAPQDQGVDVQVSTLSTTPVRNKIGAGKRVLHANGTNRDHDAALACELAGADAEIVHVNQLLVGERRLADYHMLVVPGGFSYGDDLDAGRLWALELEHHLNDQIARFVADGRPVPGICNGFQALVKAGLLPGADWQIDGDRTVTPTYNEAARFECRWVLLEPNPNSPSLFTQGLTEPILCPVAHGEGRLLARDQATLDALWAQGLAALTYSAGDGSDAPYPLSPNGSALGIAGLTNREGNVFGLMPHPENHVFPWQHPRWHGGERGLDGLRLFENGLRHA